jgi:crotonobetainyl-CoA:carnitine CoA-transferase CaiB-like acyl-CoA transferase
MSQILGAPGLDPDPQKQYDGPCKINPTVEAQKIIDAGVADQKNRPVVDNRAKIKARLEEVVRFTATRENEIAALKAGELVLQPLDRSMRLALDALLGEVESLNRDLNFLTCILIDALGNS